MKKINKGGIRLNLFLFLIISALTFIAIQKPGLNKKVIYQKISNINKDKIEHIEIVSADQNTIQFFKKDQNWFIRNTNGELPVNQEKIQYLFQLLNTESFESFQSSQDQLAKYRLSIPRISVNFDDFTIAFGDSEPLKRRRYVLIDKQIHLINDLYYHFLLQPANTYLLKTK